MASLNLKHIYKVYQGGVKAVNDFTMDIADKEFIVFVGPSGCGKSTTLRMIAGLEEITAGELKIGDTVVNNYEPKDRNIAMVFQSYALYPHMTVYNNIAYSLKIAKYDKKEIDKRVRYAAEILNISKYLDRKPRELSGGQRQRVALGRAIVREPKVFLLDEPLSNLDAKLRASMRSEIIKLHQRLQTTFIYVTHDQVEAMTMGTRIVVMKDGFVQQIDTPRNLFNYPTNKFVAGFIGTPQMNFYNAKMSLDGNDAIVDLGFGHIKLPQNVIAKVDKGYLQEEKSVCLGIRPENMSMTNDDNSIEARVEVVEALGSETIVYANMDYKSENPSKAAAVTLKVNGDELIKIGDIIKVAFNVNKVHLFDNDTENTIIQRVPTNITVKASIEAGKISLLGKTIDLPAAILENVKDGLCSVQIPTSAISLGEGQFEGAIDNVELIEPSKLYQIKCENDYVFVKTEADVELSGNVSFDIDLAKITIVGDEYKVNPLVVEFSANAAVVKVENNLYALKVNDAQFNLPTNIAQNLFTTKGKALLKTELLVKSSGLDLVQTDNGLEVKVVKVLDYGNKKYSIVSYANQEFAVSLDLEVGQTVKLAYDVNKISIIDIAQDIILI